LSFLEKKLTTEALNPEQAQAAWDELALARTPAEPAVTPEPEPVPAETIPEPEPTPAPEDTPEPAPAPAEPQPAVLPPEVQARLARLDTLEAQFASLANDHRAAVGRIGSIQSELAAAKAAAAKVQDAPTQAQVAAASKDLKKWEAMKADFPDWAEATEELLASRAVPAAPTVSQEDIDRRLTEARAQWAQDQAAQREQALRELRFETLDAAHDGWREKVATPQFRDWLQAQDDSTRALGASERVKDALTLLRRFDEAAAVKPVEIQQQRADALAAAVTTKPGKTPPPKSEDEMTREELWDLYAKKRA